MEQSLAELEHGLAYGQHRAQDISIDEKGIETLLKQTDKHAVGARSALVRSARLVQALEISKKLHTISDSQKPGSSALRVIKTRCSGGTDFSVEQARLRVSDLDEQSAKIVNEIVARWSACCQTAYLAESRPLWSLFVRGLLADAMKVDQEELNSKREKLVGAFSQRLKHPEGPAPLASKTMKELLDRADYNSLKGPGKVYWSGVNETPPETLLKRSASQEDISSLDKRLEVTLPEDYKEFLRISNGLGIDPGLQSENCREDIYNGRFPDPGMHSTTEVI